MKLFGFLVMMSLSSVASAQTVDPLPKTADGSAFVFVGSDLSFGRLRMSQSGEFSVSGTSMDLGFAGKITRDRRAPVYIEWNSTFFRGKDRYETHIEQGANPIVLSSSSSPTGSIDLLTSSNSLGVSASAVVKITDSTGDQATITSSASSPSAPNTSVSQFALSQTVSGGAFTVLGTNGATGLGVAYGAIFDDTGFLVVTAGDDGSTTLKTAVSERIDVTDHSVTLSTSMSLDKNWLFTPSFSPTYRRIDRTRKVTSTINIAQGFAGTRPVPDLAIAETVSLDSTFLGATLGGVASRDIGDGWQISIGANAGFLAYRSQVDRYENVKVAGATTDISHPHRKANGVSGTGKVSFGLSHTNKSGLVTELSAFVGYMSDVPFIDTQTVTNPTTVNSASSRSSSATGGTYRVHSVGKKSMISSGISLGFIMTF